jgi:UDP-GlcNAc:undecaprenyl-phosphate GlcNAc-1-phosphate transferase
MSTTLLLSVFSLLFILELCYFWIAEKLNIVDRPNHRSSHSTITLRGGGIIFPISLILYPLYFDGAYTFFLIGLFLIALVSFLDDIKPVSSGVRIVVHLVSVVFLFCQVDMFDLSYYWILVALFIVIGTINAINFMDGINGITGAYSLVTLISLLYINTYILEFIDTNLLIISILSVIVFNFFNFRTTAKCFAGDVGSVSIAFIIMYFLIELILKSEDLSYLLLLLIYGLDTVSTIVFRIIRGEKISEPHRSHFYQFWANERKTSHLIVSLCYAFMQLLVNLSIITIFSESVSAVLIFFFVSSFLFIAFRFYIEGSSRLLIKRV